MKKADIKVGESYRASRAWPYFGARVKVLELDVKMLYRRNPGVRVEIERRPDRASCPRVGETTVVITRDIVAPWTEDDDRELDSMNSVLQRRQAVVDRLKALDIYGSVRHDGSVMLSLDNVEKLLEKVSV